MKNHAEANRFICDHCSKEFHLEWRLTKHLEIHVNKSVTTSITKNLVHLKLSEAIEKMLLFK